MTPTLWIEDVIRGLGHQIQEETAGHITTIYQAPEYKKCLVAQRNKARRGINTTTEVLKNIVKEGWTVMLILFGGATIQDKKKKVLAERDLRMMSKDAVRDFTVNPILV